MTILLLTQPQPPEPIAALIAAAGGDLRVATDPSQVDPLDVECLVAYRLAPGTIARYPRLRLLCAAASGVEKLLNTPDLPAALPVVRVKDARQSQQIGQYVLGHAIAHVRGFATYRQQQAQHQWLRHAPPAFGQARASVLGLGHVGATVARMLVAAGFEVRGWSRTPRALDAVECFHGPQGLDACLTGAAVVVATLPLTPETDTLLHAERLSRMAQGALLINVGRGELVDDAALAASLRAGHLGAAVLDVHRTEPLPPEAAQWHTPGLFVTPHIASQPSAAAVAASVVTAWQQLCNGIPLTDRVDRDRGY